jgi:hypothetical protein
LNQQWETLVKLWNKHLYNPLPLDRFLLFFIFLRNNWPIALKSVPEHNKNKGNKLTEFLVSGTRPTTICKLGLGYFFWAQLGKTFFFGEDEHVRGYNERKKKGKISSVTFRLLTKHTE